MVEDAVSRVPCQAQVTLVAEPRAFWRRDAPRSRHGPHGIVNTKYSTYDSVFLSPTQRHFRMSN
jgi:hypothetical protein